MKRLIQRSLRPRWINWALLVCFASLGLAHIDKTFYAHAEDVSPTALREAVASPIQTEAPPEKAQELLRRLQDRHGEPLHGYVGGRVFHNRERRLPEGHYREYDVNPKLRGRPRDAERIVIDQQTGKAYYSRDHYRSFIPLN